MPLTTTWRAGNRRGYQMGSVKNPHGALTAENIAEAIKFIMDSLGSGYEILTSIR